MRNPDLDKGGSWAWGLSLLKTPNSGRETWLSLDIGAGGKVPCYTAPWRDRDTKNFMGTSRKGRAHGGKTDRLSLLGIGLGLGGALGVVVVTGS